MIRLHQVSKIYRKGETRVSALDEVDLVIEAGEFVAIRGPSGCGKSTLLALVGGLDTPTSGRVEVAGKDLAKLTAAERAALRSESIGFVFQLFHLLPYVSVVDNVLVAADGTATKALRERAETLLDDFGMSHRLTHRPAELSIGERQRVAMARALLNEPAVILADEPTGNLDPENAKAVMEIIGKYHASGGTVLLVTHDAEAAAFAQRRVHMRDGRVASDDMADATSASTA